MEMIITFKVVVLNEKLFIKNFYHLTLVDENNPTNENIWWIKEEIIKEYLLKWNWKRGQDARWADQSSDTARITLDDV